MRVAGECVGGNANPIAKQQGILAFGAKHQGQIGEQSHVALAARQRSGHRVSVRYESIVVRFAEKIAMQELKCIRRAFDLFE